MIKFGNYIRSTRKKNGLTQKEVADKVGISPQFLCDVENNKREPSESKVEKYAKALNLDSDYLFYLIGMYPPKCRNKLSYSQYSLSKEVARNEKLATRGLE